MGMKGDLMFTQYFSIHLKVFNLDKNALVRREFVGISRDYPI
jgi:hypothetical protein